MQKHEAEEYARGMNEYKSSFKYIVADKGGWCVEVCDGAKLISTIYEFKSPTEPRDGDGGKTGEPAVNPDALAEKIHTGKISLFDAIGQVCAAYNPAVETTEQRLVGMWAKNFARSAAKQSDTLQFLRYADSLGYKLRYDEELDETTPAYQEYKGT